MVAIRGTNHSMFLYNLLPIRSLRHEILKYGVLKISTIVTCLWWSMLYRQGYCSHNVALPSYLSSQNLICDQSLTMKVAKWKNCRFTFIRLAPKWESRLFHWTCNRGLLSNICCHILSVVSSLKSHLLSKAVFFIWRSWIPNPLDFYSPFSRTLLSSMIVTSPKKISWPKIIQFLEHTSWDCKKRTSYTWVSY